MAHMEKQPILNMEISDSCVYAHDMVGTSKVRISLVELGPSVGFMVARL
jgi:hypothetical protein